MEYRRIEGQEIPLNYYPRKLNIEAEVMVTGIRKREIHCKKFQHSVCLLRQVLCSEYVTSALIGTINLDADGHRDSCCRYGVQEGIEVRSHLRREIELT